MSITVADIAKAAREGLTLSVGLGLLVYQRAQVYRQDLLRAAYGAGGDTTQRHDSAKNETS